MRAGDSPAAAALPEEERARLEWVGGPGSGGYGEIQDESASRVLEWFGVTPADVLVDLGSGAGRFVVLAARTTPARRVLGIELSPTRHQLALELLSTQCAASGLRVELREGDLRDFREQDCTLAYVCSTCFHPQLLEAVSQTLLRLPRLRAVVATTPLPGLAGARFERTGILTLATTWSPAVEGVCYRQS